jgi:RNA polymerase sigma-32 factor
MPGPTLELGISPDRNLARYLQSIRKFPMLEPSEEFALAKRWVDHGDEKAAHT